MEAERGHRARADSDNNVGRAIRAAYVRSKSATVSR